VNISARSFDRVFPVSDKNSVQFAHIYKTWKMSTIHEYNIELLFCCILSFFSINDNLCQVHRSIWILIPFKLSLCWLRTFCIRINDWVICPLILIFRVIQKYMSQSILRICILLYFTHFIEWLFFFFSFIISHEIKKGHSICISQNTSSPQKLDHEFIEVVDCIGQVVNNSIF